MHPDLSPRAVEARLDELCETYTPESSTEARRRLEPPPAGPMSRSFEEEVAMRLDELRALMELTAYLRQRG